MQLLLTFIMGFFLKCNKSTLKKTYRNITLIIDKIERCNICICLKKIVKKKFKKSISSFKCLLRFSEIKKFPIIGKFDCIFDTYMIK